MQRLLAFSAVVPAVLAQTFYGCYVDIPTRALSGSSLVDYDNMTVAVCEAHCTGQSFDLWGLQYGGECYCGNALAAGAFPTFPTDCFMACGGDPLETCGGPNRLSLWGTSEEAPEFTAQPHDEVAEYVALGCWTEVAGARALPDAAAFSATAMTVAGCGDFCLNSGFEVFGLEYTSECWCGDALNPNSTNVADTECAMPCSGDAAEICGGPERLSVYQWVP
ncbi:hypothetical protein VTK26DRAFT_6016 [Humicola hyalothermophila]